MLPVTKVPRWRLEQAAVWIATRDPAQVKRYPFARLASGVAALKADLAKAREDLAKAKDAIARIEAEIVVSGLIFGGQDGDVACLKRSRDHSKTLQKHVAALEATIASAIAIPDSTQCDPASPDYSVLLKLEQALHAGALPAFGSIDAATVAPIDAAIWMGYRLEHAPSDFPARSKVPPDRMPLTLRAFSHQHVPSTALKRHFGYAYVDARTRATQHHRVIENIVVERAAVMRLWPEPGTAKAPKTGRPSQAQVAEDYRDALKFLHGRLRQNVSRARRDDESPDTFYQAARARFPRLTIGTFKKAWNEVIDEFRRGPTFHSSWLPKRGRPKSQGR